MWTSGLSATRAADGTRTHDLVLTKDALYRLSYSSDHHGPHETRVLHVAPSRLCHGGKEASKQRVKGVEPSSLAWKAMALPLSYTRRPPAGQKKTRISRCPPATMHGSDMPRRGGSAPIAVTMGGAGFEPAKASPSDLQSDPFDRSGNPPNQRLHFHPLANENPYKEGLSPSFVCAKWLRGIPLRASGGT